MISLKVNMKNKNRSKLSTKKITIIPKAVIEDDDYNSNISGMPNAEEREKWKDVWLEPSFATLFRNWPEQEGKWLKMRIRVPYF